MEWSGLAIFYLICFGVGFLFALIGAIFGEIGAHGGLEIGGHDIDVGHGVELDHGLDVGHEIGVGGHEIAAGGFEPGHDMPTAHVLNTITIATFLAFFGLAGLLTVWVFRMPAALSLAFSLPLGLFIAAMQFLLWVKVFIKAQASSEATMSDILGCEAEVGASIPSGHVGQINYTIRGSRFTAPAVSSDDTEIPRGSRVVIVNVRGNTFVVRPL